MVKDIIKIIVYITVATITFYVARAFFFGIV
ncbi:hypothetical protein METP3_00991 [Methanosarcinales archaeon]|nr:hypothetical protein METP3_00991 [Methanosarcinales archaeon]